MLAFINGLSPMHLLLVLVVALLLFGNRLPEVMRSIGRSINEFKRGMSESEDAGKASSEPMQRLSPPSQPTEPAKRESEQTRTTP